MKQDNALKQIALLRLSAIGDAVLLVPLVRTLQQHYPKAQITWIIGSQAYSLLKGLSGVEFVVINKPNSLKSLWHCYRHLSPYRFDVLLAAQASLRANLLCPLIKAPIKIGYDKARANDGHRFFIHRSIKPNHEHLLDGFMAFAKALGISEHKLQWDLPINRNEHDWAKQQLSTKPGRWLAINPAASKADRNWLAERYAEVIDQAVSRWPLNVVLTGSPTPEAHSLSADILALTASPDRIINLTGKTDLKQLAALLGEVDALLAPDTGPIHIASAMNTPVIGLYAGMTAKLSGPYLSPELTIDKHTEAITTILKCDPKTIKWNKRIHDPRAMALISVDDVMEKLAYIFDKVKW